MSAGGAAGVGGGGGQGILSLAIKDKASLYTAYMPYLRNGGVFVPTPKRYFLGAEVFVLLTLPESSERLPVAGKVVWVTPPGARLPWAPGGVTQTTLPATGRRSLDSGRGSSTKTSAPRK